MKALIICENGLEECEALITYDLLTRAKIETVLVGTSSTVTSSHNLTFNTNARIEEINPSEYDCLILPGGMPGTTNLENNKNIDKQIDYFMEHNKIIAAICAAPSILIKKGILKDNEFTCYPGFESNHISTKEKVHVHKNIITSNGMGSAIDFGLKIIEELLGKDTALEIKNKIQY